MAKLQPPVLCLVGDALVVDERCGDEALNAVAPASLRRMEKLLRARPAIEPACFSRCRLIAHSRECDAYLMHRVVSMACIACLVYNVGVAHCPERQHVMAMCESRMAAGRGGARRHGARALVRDDRLPCVPALGGRVLARSAGRSRYARMVCADGVGSVDGSVDGSVPEGALILLALV